jgi:hypothetical protein
MTLLVGALAIHKALAAVKDSEVVNEVDISSLRLKLKSRRLGNRLNGIESLDLARVQFGNMIRARVGGIAQKCGSAKIHHQTRALVEDDRTAMKLGSGVSPCQHWQRQEQRRKKSHSTYSAKGQSERARVRRISGRVAAKTLYTEYAEEIMHFPPSVAVFRVNQATISPASSLWNVW